MWILACCRPAFEASENGLPGRTYYVSTRGKDAGPGTEREPWQTIDRVNQVDLQPGDKVLFQGGEIFKGMLLLDSLDAGVLDAKVMISSFGKGLAQIDGGDDAALRADRCDYLVLKNLIIRGSGRLSGNTADGILMVDCDGIFLDSLQVFGFQHSGVHIHKSNNASITHIHAHDNGFAGIHVSGTTIHDTARYDNHNLYIAHCTAENNPGDPTVLGNHSGNGILASSINKGIIEYCRAFNNGWDMPWTENGPVGIWIWDANNVIIQHCISHDNKTARGAQDGGGFDFDGGVSNSILQYNLSYRNEGPGIGLFEFGAGKPWKDNIVRFNLSVDDGRTTQGGLRIWKADGVGKMSGCIIHNNTIINQNKDNYAIGLLTNVPGIHFFNNILLYDKEFLWTADGLGTESFKNNLYWNIGNGQRFMGFDSFEKWANATDLETESGRLLGIWADPLIYNINAPLPTDPGDINLQSLWPFVPGDNSPAKKRGITLDVYADKYELVTDLVGRNIQIDTPTDLGALNIPAH
jgi:hypothetical protein